MLKIICIEILRKQIVIPDEQDVELTLFVDIDIMRIVMRLNELIRQIPRSETFIGRIDLMKYEINRIADFRLRVIIERPKTQ